MADDTTKSAEYGDEDLRFFAYQLFKSGRYRVQEITSTPKSTETAPKLTFNVTPTPIREHIRESAKGIQNVAAPFSAHTHSDPPPIPPRPYFDQGYTSLPSFSHAHSASGSRIDYLTRIPELPKFSGEEKAPVNMFEVWKYDVNCLIDEGMYPMHIIREAIRKSLKGTARGVLLHLGEHASVVDILTELEGVYGNVQSSERLKEQFYSESQKPGESVADYSLRLERLLSRVLGIADRAVRDEMLRNRLWSGLKDQELKNVSRYLFEKNAQLQQIEEGIEGRRGRS